MIYQTTLVLEKDSSKEGEGAIQEIAEYVQEKKGKILDSKLLGERQIALDKKRNAEASIYRIMLELLPEEVSKVKKKIGQEKTVISFILEKRRIIKPKAKEEKKEKEKEKPRPKKAKQKESQATKVLDSMQEEEEKIKDLDSTLDELLNE